jgi:tetratricopeptide (TPR) repeat protein
LVALNRLGEAEEIFRKIVQDHSKFAPALSNLGYVYFLKGDLEYAESLFDKALALDPDYEQAMMNKVALFLALKKNTEAATWAEKVLKLNPQNEKARMVLRQRSL